ncbi:deoxyguanosinetriphosphate triphosphohydrolase [Desulfonema magnum]|uniref:Deoxyguanosinetriphosphate triphosphohydrolase-like protein n=1 Tax=Desulfonema magnum TaxID=45655 RepID=A0A975BQF7_9BACT|nr:deoxyguanosinetriphosphate triphosphohydrolase [Desulfonema magnum]QTA89791.1 Deoxyguanosinetriphosphate triphosphohydrolase [Desulfonema magnum]
MSIREEFEKREKSFMSPFGCLSAESRGRIKTEISCPIRTAFQVDKDRIVYSNAFRRLKHKTQVFLSPLGDHYRTRLTHTLEVAQIARTIARAMRLNEDLTEAIALGHDLGHTPFGHSGETGLKEIFSKGFSHNEQSLRVIEVLENKGKGLNLTYEVRDGILKHSKGYGSIVPDDPNDQPCTAEGKVVRFADIMAYLNHDLDDAIRSRVIRADQVPESCSRVLGHSHWERATTMMRDIIFSSEIRAEDFQLNMSSEVCSAMSTLRHFLYENVYRSPQVHEEFIKAKKILSELYARLLNDRDLLWNELKKMEMEEVRHNGDSHERTVCDLIASMTDRYALDLYSAIFFPSPFV